MINFIKYFSFGVILGLVLLFFFIGLDANAMIIDNTKEEIRDSDIIGSTFIATEGNQYAKIQYIDEWIDELPFDEIGENYTRSGNTYKIYSGKKHHRSGDLWFNVKYATSTLSEWTKYTDDKIGFLKYIIPIANAQDSFYSDAGDGRVYYTNANWDTAHDSATGLTTDTLILVRLGYPTSQYRINRGFIAFDTSSIDSDQQMASGSIFMYSYDGYDNCNDANGYIALTGSTDPDPETLETGDYDNFTDTEMSDSIDSTVINNAGYNRFILNSNGRNEFDPDGWTQYTVREGHDINDVACSNGYAGSTFYTVTESGKEPYLLVDTEDIPAASTSTPTSTTTSVSIPCDLVPNNELSMAVWCVEEWGESTTTPEKTYYGYAHIPFFIWFIILIPTLFIAYRMVIEFTVRMRQ